MGQALKATHLYYLFLILVCGIATVYFSRYLVFGAPLEQASFDYGHRSASEQCKNKAGAADHQAMKTESGLRYTLTTPKNFRPDVPHPLVVVWAPSMAGSWLNERLTGLTRRATGKGFIIAHVASVRLSTRAILELETVPRTIIDRWCVNPEAIYYTGHSDGGTVAMALTLLPGAKIQPRAIAPSAMGMDATALAEFSCPSAIDVMILHNVDDTHFPGFGAEAVRWWAACQHCDLAAATRQTDGCIHYPGCARDVRIQYCEGQGGHIRWPGTRHDPIQFFSKTRQWQLAEKPSVVAKKTSATSQIDEQPTTYK